MDEKPHVPMEDMEMFRTFVEVADEIWPMVKTWTVLAQDTIGVQIIRYADSVGANLVEGYSTYTTADSLNFFMIARASARETRYWIEQALVRSLITRDKAASLTEKIHRATRQLNSVISYRRSAKAAGMVKGAAEEYNV